MQLYFAPFACSLASHITLREAGVPFDLVQVTLSTKKTADGGDYLAVTPKGQVPALRLDNGSVLTEGPAVLQYIADSNPASGLIPPVGDRARYEVLEWVNFVGTEIHKACFALMFNPKSPPEAKEWARASIADKLQQAAAQAGDRAFLVGDRFTIADAYFAWALNICGLIGVPLPESLQRYFDGIKSRPAVQAAIEVEAAARG